MKKAIGIAVATIVLALGLSACAQDASKTDIKEPQFEGDALPTDYSARVPDVLTVYQNVDLHPTIVKLCIEGIAFRTLSSTHSGGLNSGAVERVPEWDVSCPKPDWWQK